MKYNYSFIFDGLAHTDSIVRLDVGLVLHWTSKSANPR
jgi:hypothetical protein